MPREIECEDRRECTLEDCITALREMGFDPACEGSLVNAAGWLRQLGNNRHFLGDMLIEQLKERHRDAGPESTYGPQVVMLSPAAGSFFMRANIWPSRAERCFQTSGGASFVYELPHDHNFDFLTVGYFGPGYWSDYWEEDYDALHGWRGEYAGLRYVERSHLAEGRLLHYRAHRDVHSQLPPDSLSVSLNIMHATGAQGWLDQYRFDLDAGRVTGILNNGASEAFVRIAVALGGEEARDLAQRFGRHHPSDRMRLAAWGALASVAKDPDTVWREAEQAGSRLVAGEAKLRRRELATI